MEQLIFIALIVFFSVIESMARARKARKEGGAPTPDDDGRAVPGPTRRRVPTPRREQPHETAGGAERMEPGPYATYDADPSYDDAVEGRWQGSGGAGSGRASGTSTAGTSTVDSSEELIPAEVWKEIMGLARGQTRREDESPRHMERRPAPVRRKDPLSRAPAPPELPVPAELPAPLSWEAAGGRLAKPAPVHKIHLSHRGYGTDPSERAPSSLSAPGSDQPHGNDDAARVRAMLRAQGDQGGRSTLRQAIILHEVLGPPAGLREE